MKRASKHFVALAWTSFIYAAVANANGINPPRPALSPLVKVECVDRKSNAVLTATRATTMQNPMPGILEVILDNEASRSIKISKLIAISFTTTDIDKNGYASALLETLEPKFKGKGSVRVRADNKAISIKGFDLSGKRTTFPMTECKTITFETTSVEDSYDTPPAAAAK